VGQLAILRHGDPGLLSLGGGELVSAQTVQVNAATWAELAGSLAPDAGIDLYGCSTGEGEQCLSLVTSISDVTVADVGATADGTGTIRGCNWDLEVRSGESPFGHLLDPGLLEGPSHLS
jgi:hypothetical protein